MNVLCMYIRYILSGIEYGCSTMNVVRSVRISPVIFFSGDITTILNLILKSCHIIILSLIT